MDENTSVLWDQNGVETTFEKVFSIEIEGEHYIMLSPVNTKFCIDEDEDEILVFKLKDSDHGELLVHLKDDECRVLTQKCKDVIQRFINNYED